jgi:hypothetical protein
LALLAAARAGLVAVGVLAVAAAWVADGSVLAALATGATVLVTGADVGPLEPEPAPVVLVGESAEDPAEDPEPVEAELVGDAAELVAEAAGATVEPTAEVTGDVAEPTAEPTVEPTAEVTGDVAEPTAEPTVEPTAEVTVEAEPSVDEAEPSVEAVDAADVCFDVRGASAAVAACAGRENSSKTTKIPAATSAACIAARAMRRTTGCDMSSSTRGETGPPAYPPAAATNHARPDLLFGHHRTVLSAIGQGRAVAAKERTVAGVPWP